MTAFDLAEVRDFAAGLNQGMDRCENGDGVECATLDETLLEYARLCCDFSSQVRRWGREVFAGRVAFDPDVERVFREEGDLLYSRAFEMWTHARKAETPRNTLDVQSTLQAALWDLGRLIHGWVTPGLAVGPSARQGLVLSAAAADEARKRIASAPPLPANWQPDDVRQQATYRKLRKS